MGTLGLGEMLIRLGKRYGQDSQWFVDELYPSSPWKHTKQVLTLQRKRVPSISLNMTNLSSLALCKGCCQSFQAVPEEAKRKLELET